MIAVDTNILVYAHRKDSQWHDKARDTVSQLAEGKAAWAIPWPCVYEFFGIVTHPKIFQIPTSFQRAIDQIEAWNESPRLSLLSETSDAWASLAKLLSQAQICGPAVHDARIAALCQLFGVRELWTADRDFNRFSDLATRNPLVMNA
jgi:uncharacterized protein